jgi:hypothetical protein
VKTRSVVRTTIRWLLFGTWLAIGLAVIFACFFRGGRDAEIANSGMDFRIERAAPPQQNLLSDVHGEAISNDIDASAGMNFSGSGSGGGGSGLGRIHGLGNIDTGGGLGKGVHDGSVSGNGMAAVRPKAVTIPAPKVALKPSAADAGESSSDVDRKLADLPLGNIAFNTPETIPLGENARIELLVSLKQAEDELRQAVRAAGPVETAHVKISDQMEARLTGLGFRIEAITPERQAVTRGEPTQWQWQIEPNRSARLELHLTLSALIEVDGVPATRAVRTFERTIQVEVPLIHRVTDFLVSYDQLLLSFVLIPVVGGIYRHVRKKKRSAAANEETPPSRQAA